MPTLFKLKQPVSWFRNSTSFDNHEFVITLTDKETGLKAIIAIHDRSRGIAHGGTRMKAYHSDAEALEDVLKLSKAMTYKSALANLPYGGAKGVIVLTGKPIDKEALLKSYAEKVEALNGLFHTGTDMGLAEEDVVYMSQFCKYMLGATPSNEGYSTSKAAAYGVYNAIKAAARFRYGSDDLKGKVVGIKGVGKLGGQLARLLYDDGAQLLVADVDQATITALRKESPTITEVKASEIHKTVMDIYAPCAFGDEFSARTVRELRCDIVAGGANNQLSNNQAGKALYQRGILYVPDYIANAGGLIFVSDELEADGFKLERVLHRLKAIQATVTAVLEQSANQHLPTNSVADLLAQQQLHGKNL